MTEQIIHDGYGHEYHEARDNDKEK